MTQSSANNLYSRLTQEVERLSHKALSATAPSGKNLFGPLLEQASKLLAQSDTIPKPPFASHRKRLGRAVNYLKSGVALTLFPLNRFLLHRQVEFNHLLLLSLNSLVRRLIALTDRASAQTARMEFWRDEINRRSDELANMATTVQALLDRREEGRRGHSAAPSPLSGSDYFAFENQFRGSEGDIRDRMRIYLSVMRKANGPILDLGCGRGELLEVLTSAGLKAEGLDSNEHMVQRCLAKGLTATAGDMFQYLSQAAPQSYGAISAIQVIEHLDRRDIDRFLALALTRLKPGGFVLLETINPHCLQAMQFYFADPTHRTLVYPEMLAWTMKQQGFVDVSTSFIHPVDQSLWLSAKGNEALAPVVDRLNQMFFGAQDFYAIGHRLGSTSAEKSSP
jgi:2-polyprenyl-3-methyl-5-hydroxy-6-metoxy-1,4-benzoquinol methylase